MRTCSSPARGGSSSSPRGPAVCRSRTGRPRAFSCRASWSRRVSRTPQSANANESASAIELAVVAPAEELGVLLDQRLGERDVEHQRPHEVEAAPRIGVEVRRLARHEVLDRLRDLRVLAAGAAPLVDAEPDLLGHEVGHERAVGRVGPRVGQPLAAEILVHPGREAGVVAAVALELVVEDLPALGVVARVAGVDRGELADVDRRPGPRA